MPSSTVNAVGAAGGQRAPHFTYREENKPQGEFLDSPLAQPHEGDDDELMSMSTPSEYDHSIRKKSRTSYIRETSVSVQSVHNVDSLQIQKVQVK